MNPIAAFTFEDLEERCEAYAGIRASDGKVAVSLSIEGMQPGSNNAIALYVTPQVARELAVALEAGAKYAEGANRDA